MTSREALEIIKRDYFGVTPISETAKHICCDEIEKDLRVLEILKPRIKLKDSKIKNTYFTLNEKGCLNISSDLMVSEVAFIEASGFVFKNSDEHKLLKEWLENEK